MKYKALVRVEFVIRIEADTPEDACHQALNTNLEEMLEMRDYKLDDRIDVWTNKERFIYTINPFVQLEEQYEDDLGDTPEWWIE